VDALHYFDWWARGVKDSLANVHVHPTNTREREAYNDGWLATYRERYANRDA
jgi:hypothetical protein